MSKAPYFLSLDGLNSNAILVVLLYFVFGSTHQIVSVMEFVGLGLIMLGVFVSHSLENTAKMKSLPPHAQEQSWLLVNVLVLVGMMWQVGFTVIIITVFMFLVGYMLFRFAKKSDKPQ